MRSRWLLALALIFCCLHPFAQPVTLSGKVTDDRSGAGLAGASIFISNTSIGTASGNDGTFFLRDLPRGRYDLVISMLGYENQIISLNTMSPTGPLDIRLKEKTHELEGVTLRPYDKDGWATWGRFFTETVIGTTPEAADCRIVNQGVVRLHFSKTKNELTAFADEPVVIENQALGYRIRYQLERYSYQFANNYLFFAGYPFFEELTGRNGQLRKWNGARREAYLGSVLQFVRSIYTDSLAEHGFEVRRLKLLPNTEKQRVRPILARLLRSNITVSGKLSIEEESRRDSTEYYKKVVTGPDAFELLDSRLLAADSLRRISDPAHCMIWFPDYLHVRYKGKPLPASYLRYNSKETQMDSRISIISGKPVELFSDGSYFSPTDLMEMGYWAWSEKLATMLPYNYRP